MRNGPRGFAATKGCPQPRPYNGAVAFQLLVAPPGAGKTTMLLQRTREAALAGERVWWVGLPSQRSHLYRLATEGGALLGLEFLTRQQILYHLLAHAQALQPLVVGTGRLAMVGEALMTLRDELPSPGEAGLFVRAISEAKQQGLTPEQIPAGDSEGLRLREVYDRYQQIKGGSWDYDDFLIEAAARAEGLAGDVEADLIVVDGLPSVLPLELRLYRALGGRREVWLSLPEAPPGIEPSHGLDRQRPEVVPCEVRRHLAANPVAESRWVLRALKRDLASGFAPLDLAVIAPQSELRAFAALADEYGVPLMDETPRALADTLPGRLLLDLLELPDYPTASRLLAIGELAPLASAALEAGIAGFEAIEALAAEIGLAGLWRTWRSLLEVENEGEEMAWARTLLDSGLPAVRGDLLEWDGGYPRFREHALQRAQEALRVGRGPNFRAWWAALLNETFVFERPRGGVALLSAQRASGRRFRRAYLLRAVEGAYGAGESEDYFVPEEARSDPQAVFVAPALPRRFQGRDSPFYRELLSRADTLIVTCPEADQGGPLTPDRQLMGVSPEAPPPLPAASRLELGGDPDGYRAPLEGLPLGAVAVEGLRRYSDCSFRFWAEQTLPRGDPAPWWRELIGDLRTFGRLNPARSEELARRYPEAASWLERHAEILSGLTFGLELPEDGSGPRARLDAAGRDGGEVSFYRFAPPGSAPDRAAAGEIIERRWSEYWAAGYMLERYPGRVTRVFVVVWPLLGDPVSVFEGGIERVWRRIARRRQLADEAHRRLLGGEVRPNPGFRCRTCPVSDLCREGAR